MRYIDEGISLRDLSDKKGREKVLLNKEVTKAESSQCYTRYKCLDLFKVINQNLDRSQKDVEELGVGVCMLIIECFV